MMLQLGREDLAKYPYLNEARTMLKSSGLDLTHFNHDADLTPVIEKAYRRITVALNGDVYNESGAPEMEVMSFHIACIMVRAVNNYRVTNKFTLAEARRSEKYLIRDIMTNESIITKIIKDYFGMTIMPMGKYYLIPIPDYLKRAIHFNKQEWKLVNRLVHDGQVYLTAHEAVRLIRAELDRMLNNRIKNMSYVNIESFAVYIERILAMAHKFKVIPKPTSMKNPPCIEHALDVLRRGENLSHSGRFMLATFMLNRETPIDEIVNMFASAPDYKEKVTLYQIKQLNGEHGGGQKYTCPGCSKIKSLGLCYRTDECGKIVNPLQFGT